MQNKIIFSILVAFSISIFTILWINLAYPEPDTKIGIDHVFYLKKFDPKKERVFLVGSSNIGQVNTTSINEIVSKNNSSFEVYNLAISSDHPSTRLPHLEKTIVLKPKLVIYGITYRDFQLCGFNSFECDKEINRSILPDIKKIVEGNLPKEIQQDKLNPQLTTLRIIRDFFKDSQLFTEQNKIRPPNNAFYYIDPNFHHTIIENDEELKKQSDLMKKEGFMMDTSNNSSDVKALKIIIMSLKENNIDVILYLMPQNGPYYLDNISNKNKENFNLMIDKISSEFNVQVYNFTDKYSKDKVWGDTRHVSYNTHSRIFSNDMAKIIIDEIR